MARPGRPVFVFHDRAQAQAAILAARQVGRPLALITARAAGAVGGPALYLEMVRQAGGGAETELIVDCGDNAAVAVEALGLGAAAVVLRGTRAVQARVGAIAEGLGARLLRRRPVAHDLPSAADPAAFCRALLARP